MSGAGKSTLAEHIQKYLNRKNFKVIIIDGDSVRDSYKEKLGFGFNDVLKNNLRIVNLCLEKRIKNYDFILVPVISPYEKIRQTVRKSLMPNFHLIYLNVDIKTLKERDPKGLYAAADRGEIKNLIGYSKISSYEEPNKTELTLKINKNDTIAKSLDTILEFLKQKSLI